MGVIKMTIEKGHFYQHQNGHTYEILGLAGDEHDNENSLVVLAGLHDGRLWVRPVDNFTGLHANGQPRFHRVEKEP